MLDLLGFGVSLYAELFRSLGADVTVLHGKPDGSAINVACGSTHPEPCVRRYRPMLRWALPLMVMRTGCLPSMDVVAWSIDHISLWGADLADADRLPEQRLVATVMSTSVSSGLALGVVCLNVRLLAISMFMPPWPARASLGGEQSGHIISADYGMSGDGLLTALHLVPLPNPVKLWLTVLMKASAASLSGCAM